MILLFGLTLASTASFGQNVGGFILGKIQNFQQTSSAAPVVNSAQPFQFGALITMGTATINAATLTFTGTSSPRMFTDDGTGTFSILDTFTTQAQLDAAYQSSNFTVNIDTSSGAFSRMIFLFPFSYPTTAQLTVAASNWQSNTLVVDPAMDYTFTWSAFSNAQAADVIQLVIRNSSLNLNPFPATQTSYVLPAGSLQPNTDYPCDLVFVRVAGATAGDANIGPGYATLAKDTGFLIHTTAQATPTPTATPTATPAMTATATPTATAAPTAAPSTTPTPTSTPAPTATATPTVAPTPTPMAAKALNISTRMQVDAGNNVLIGGFIITGNASKSVAVRGIGPSLSSFVSGVLADPTLELRASTGSLIFPNDNWQDNSAQAAQLSALGLALQDPKESGIFATLQPGGYTAILAGKNNGTGIGLVEIYDANNAVDSQLANISTRGFVLTGNNVMIGGFILGGNSNTHVVVRGIGPSLAQFGLNPVLDDPTLELHDANGALLIANDNWQDDPVSAAQLTAIGLAPQDPLESGIYTSLPPAAFTAILAGKNGGTGIGLVEVYNVH